VLLGVGADSKAFLPYYLYNLRLRTHSVYCNGVPLNIQRLEQFWDCSDFILFLTYALFAKATVFYKYLPSQFDNVALLKSGIPAFFICVHT